jgi:hypothetical protein
MCNGYVPLNIWLELRISNVAEICKFDLTCAAQQNTSQFNRTRHANSSRSDTVPLRLSATVACKWPCPGHLSSPGLFSPCNPPNGHVFFMIQVESCDWGRGGGLANLENGATRSACAKSTRSTSRSPPRARSSLGTLAPSPLGPSSPHPRSTITAQYADVHLRPQQMVQF